MAAVFSPVRHCGIAALRHCGIAVAMPISAKRTHGVERGHGTARRMRLIASIPMEYAAISPLPSRFPFTATATARHADTVRRWKRMEAFYRKSQRGLDTARMKAFLQESFSKEIFIKSGMMDCAAVSYWQASVACRQGPMQCQSMSIPHGNDGRWRAQLLAPWRQYQEGCGRARLPTAATRAAWMASGIRCGAAPQLLAMSPALTDCAACSTDSR